MLSLNLLAASRATVQPTVEQRWPGCPSPVTRPAADYAPVSGCDVEAVLLIPSLDADQAAKAPDQAVDVASQGCIDLSLIHI